MEWSEECAFQSMNNTVVKCRGRRFSRDLLDLPLYTYIMERKGSGKVVQVEEYGIVTLDFRTFLGKMSDCPQKMSGSWRAERCAHQRVPPPPPPPPFWRDFSQNFRFFAQFWSGEKTPSPAS